MVNQILIFSGLIISATCSFLHTAPLPFILDPIRDAPVSYDFSYHVNDANTGDFKSQSEARRGDTVLGQYSLIQPDGVRRVVDYQANDLTGFIATVTNQPLINPIDLNRAPQTPEVQDNQISQDNQRPQSHDLQQQYQQQQIQQQEEQYQNQQIQQQQQQEQQELQQQYHQQQQQKLQKQQGQQKQQQQQQQQEQQQLQQQYHQQQQQQLQQQQVQQQQQQPRQQQLHQQYPQQQQQQLQQQYQEEASRSTTVNSGISIENKCPNCANSTPPSISQPTVFHPYQNNLWL